MVLEIEKYVCSLEDSGQCSSHLPGWLLHWSRSVRRWRLRMRFGKLAQAPLSLLRLDIHGNSAECDWMSRPHDKDHYDLPGDERERRTATRALQDAVAIRSLLFRSLPQVSTVNLRAYRATGPERSELIVTGTVARSSKGVKAGPIARRAKSLGLRFWMQRGKLMGLDTDGVDLKAALLEEADQSEAPKTGIHFRRQHVG